GISVSNVVNGTTRLQPCVMLTGQAAGATAAWAVKQKLQPRAVAVRTVQETLLKAGAYIMPYYDVKPTHPHFIAIQKIGASGILRGKGEPFQWANRTWFYPDTTINVEEIYPPVKEGLVLPAATKALLTIEQAIAFSASLGKALNARNSFSFTNPSAFAQEVEAAWGKWGLQQFQYTRPVTRAELAVLLYHTVDPFNALQVNHTGDFVKPNNYN
ncbi:MAG: FAD-dependent oxidoreductase, partial [Bacteroidetes bacterium]|nr:FAD-dependent oxidoreductase [Bacteroidota bacterium]